MNSRGQVLHSQTDRRLVANRLLPPRRRYEKAGEAIFLGPVLSRRNVNALLVLARIAQEPGVNAPELAKIFGYSRRYLEDTMQLLVRAGVLKSKRGPKGGYQVDPGLSLGHIIRTLQPHELTTTSPQLNFLRAAWWHSFDKCTLRELFDVP